MTTDGGENTLEAAAAAAAAAADAFQPAEHGGAAHRCRPT